jgi:AraC-like DNA-binding protein
MRFDPYSLFGLVAIGQGFFLLIFLALKRWKSVSYRLLGGILFVLLFEVVHDFCVRTRLILDIPHLLSTAHFFSYCIGPLIFLYVLSLTKNQFKLRLIHLIHFIPFVLYNISKLPKYGQTFSQKLSFLTYYYGSLDKDPRHFFESRGIHDILEGFLRYDVHKIIYVAIAFYYFFNYQRKILNEYSTLEKTNIKWMRIILFGYLAIWLLIPIQRFSGYVISDVILVNDIGYLLLPLHIYFISFIAFSQQASSLLPESSKSKKDIDEEKLKEILNRCNEYINESKAYLKAELTLSLLSAELGVRPHDLSFAINYLQGVNFLDYVNSFRVQESMRLLGQEDNQQYTVEYIGTMAGFSSKATFYRAFKKCTGKSPSQYQKSTQLESK